MHSRTVLPNTLCQGALRLSRRNCGCVTASAKAKKSLGQNFLANPDILQRIADAANLAPQHAVLEVGPGTGNLTRCLLSSGASVTAIEKDRRLIKQLSAEFPQVHIIEADILTHDLEGCLGRMRQEQREASSGAGRVKVVGNLPFYITQDFLRKLLPLGHLVSSAILLLQEEAALRLTQVAPGASDFRAMSIETQYYSRATPLFTVPKTEFSPVPDVNGLVVDFDLHLPEGRAVADAEGFLAMVRQAFSMKRKMLRNCLQACYSVPQIEAAMSAAKLDAQLRPQQLSFDDYVLLYKGLHSQMQ